MSEPSSAEAPWPVRTVSRKLTEWISRLGEVWVEGQVAQLSLRAGTAFLVLRDTAADMSLNVTCRRDLIETMPVSLVEGTRVVVRARTEFYPARGSLSLRANEIRAVGVGELLARIERLRQLLAAEGLFDATRKKRLPFLPRVVGLVTGRSSAAEHDVVTNARRRWPAVQFRIHPCAVQGPTAARSVIEGIALLDADPDVDVIVVARGGGSVEDLLPFSDEGLCRAVAASGTPVVSAIGHESDTTLIDHVADLRASTPTDAGLRVVPDLGAERTRLTQLRGAATSLVSRRVADELTWLARARATPTMADPGVLVDRRETDIAAMRSRTGRELRSRVQRDQADLRHTRARVVALSPAATLARGYAVVTRADGSVLRRPDDVAVDEALSILVSGGRLRARVSDSSSGPNNDGRVHP